MGESAVAERQKPAKRLRSAILATGGPSGQQDPLAYLERDPSGDEGGKYQPG